MMKQLEDGWYQETDNGLEPVDRISDITSDSVTHYVKGQPSRKMFVKTEVLEVK